MSNTVKTHPYVTNPVIFSKEQTTFINPVKHIQKPIVNEQGKFTEFPGVENLMLVLSKLDAYWTELPAVISYRTEFHYENDGRHLVIWEIQPDGWYWADSGGFGAENDDEVRLYSYLDENGDFTAPFRIYNVGNNTYFGTSQEDDWGKTQEKRRNCRYDESMDEQLPKIFEYFRKKLKADRNNPEVSFQISDIEETAHMYFVSTSKGGYLAFRFGNCTSKLGNDSEPALILYRGELWEYERYLTFELTIEHVKNAIWTYYNR